VPPGMCQPIVLICVFPFHVELTSIIGPRAMGVRSDTPKQFLRTFRVTLAESLSSMDALAQPSNAHRVERIKKECTTGCLGGGAQFTASDCRGSDAPLAGHKA
jgi:hypothetical protein